MCVHVCVYVCVRVCVSLASDSLEADSYRPVDVVHEGGEDFDTVQPGQPLEDVAVPRQKLDRPHAVDQRLTRRLMVRAAYRVQEQV